MKSIKLNLIFTLLFFSFISSSYSSEFNNLFGLRLYIDAEKHFQKNFINTNKVKNKETHSGFYDLEVTGKIVKKNPFLSSYWVVLDQGNFINQISAEEEMINLDKCIKFKNQLTKIFIEKYTFFFQNKEYNHKNFYTHSHYSTVDDNKYLIIKCVDFFSTNKINLIISFESKLYRNRKKEFYESGF